MKRRTKRIFIGALIFLLLFGGGLGYFYKTFASQMSEFPERWQLLRDIYFVISNYYVDDVDKDKLITGAIEGMVEELDPYSTYLEPKEYEDLQSDLLEGVFGGVGISITIRDDKLTIVTPIKDTPGERAGLMAGDIITEVDGKSTDGISTDTAVKWMRGEPGTDVTLTIKREGEEPKKVEITRALIEVPYIDYELKEDQIGYLNVVQFGSGVGMEIQDAMKDLSKQGAKGIIMDLRNNPGGLLNEAVNVSSNFIQDGPVVHVKHREGIEDTYEINQMYKHYDLPVVILVNGGSASASEIVSGAMQDTGRGLLVGNTTFGKGTVQNIVPLSDGSAFKMTTARYYTPEHRFIHEDGIEPDVKLEINIERFTEKSEDNQLIKAEELLKEMMNGKNVKELKEEYKSTKEEKEKVEKPAA